MAGNTRDIKKRIESIKSTKQITNAMKMVAAAKLRKAQAKIINARPYADYTNKMIRIVKLKNKYTQNSLLLEPDESEKNVIIIVTADKGLCGSFNSNILRKAFEYISDHKESDIICIGKKGFDQLKKKSDRIIDSFLGMFNEMDFTVSKKISDSILDLFLNQGYGKIDVIYNEFKSAIQHNIVIKQLLPIIPVEDKEISQLDFIYEPDERTIINELGKKFIEIEIWRILLESSAAEQGARMTAMDSATENAAELIQQLTLYYNRARQASITTEIVEIASGAEAINN